MCHGRKSRSVRVDGYKRHVLHDLDTGLIRAVGVTPANIPEASVTKTISEDLDQQAVKLKLLAEMQTEQTAWLALLDEIGEENMTQPEVAGGWSIKDIVAHLTGWRRRTVLRFRAALDPTVDMTPDYPAELDEDDEVDEINAWIYKANRDRPLADVLNDSREVFQQLVAEVSALSDEQLGDPQRFPWLEGERLTGAFIFGHFHEEHEPDMRAWLDKVKKEG
jgi:hypothetical protein